MPQDVEEAVKVLETKPEVDEPWGLAQYMKKKGYKMPKKASEDERELRKSFEKELDKPEIPKDVGVPKKAEEDAFTEVKFARPVGPMPSKKDTSDVNIFAKKLRDRAGKPHETLPHMQADETSDYLESLKTRKSLLTPPKGPKPKGPEDLPSERFSSEEERKPSEHAFSPYTKKDVEKQGVILASPVRSKNVPPPAKPPEPKKVKQTPRIGPAKAPKAEPLRPSQDVRLDRTKKLREMFFSKPTVSKTPQVHKELDVQDKPFEKSELKTQYKGAEDMLVYPSEFKMGMKEEMEHTDVIGQDKEALKKIVLAHLKEDPKYYTKLGSVMKAEDGELLGVVTGLPPERHRRIKKDLPGNHPLVRSYEDKHLPTTEVRKAEEEPVLMHKQKEKLPPTPRQQALKYRPKEEFTYLLPKAKPMEEYAEEEGKDIDADGLNELYSFMTWLIDRGMKPNNKSYAQYAVEQYAMHAEEEKKPKQFTVESLTKKDKRPTLGETESGYSPELDVPHLKAEELELPKKDTSEDLHAWIQKMGTSKSKKHAVHPSEQIRKEFGEEQKKQSTSDKLGEMEKPARFTAEPVEEKAEEKGLMDKVKDTVKDLVRSPKVPPYEPPVPLTKKGVIGITRKIKSGV